MDTVKIEVKEALSSLTEECWEKLLDHLTALGVEDKEDLKLLTEDDLIGVLQPIQCRKLLDKWASTGPKTNNRNSNCEHGDDQEVSLRPDPGRFRDSKRRHGSYETDSHCSSSSSQLGVEDTPTDAEQQYKQTVLQDIHQGTRLGQAGSGSSWTLSDVSDSWSDLEDMYRQEFPDKEDGTGDEPANRNLEERRIVENKGAELNYLIATELMTTERDYVARLHILYNIFYVELEKENKFSPFLPDNALPLIFSNTKSIYLFHKDFILPQLEERIAQWSSDQSIGDIMKNNAPFLKIYAEFVHNLRTAVKHIEEWRRKSSRFSEIVHRLEQLPECERLSFQHLMLEPVQRLVRYQLLLTEYVRALPEDSPDLHDSQEALVLVSKAALHSNEALKKLEVFKKKLEIYQKLRGVPQDFITPTRHLLAHGPVTEISTKRGENHPRHLFLFNDLILVCTENKSTDTYSVWKSLGIEGLKVTPCPNSFVPNTFEVSNKQGSCLLLDQNLTGASFGWEQKIKTLLNSYLRKKKERLSAFSGLDYGPSSEENNDSECQIGQVRPVHVSDSAITKCMICEGTFGLVRRKQNCMACGKLMCKPCSRRASLQYKQGKKETVCLGCFDAITRDTRPNLSTAVLFEDTDSYHCFSQA